MPTSWNTNFIGGLYLKNTKQGNYRGDTYTTKKSADQIFDHAFKKMLTLSSKAVTNMINGLFGTDHDPSTTTITYHWTEHQADGTLKTTLADSILILNDKYAYHMEAQITEDNEIVFRVFSYGYGYADVNKEIHTTEFDNKPVYTLHFPEPRIIYLGDVSSSVPDELQLKLDFQNNSPYIDSVPTVKLAQLSAQELNDRKMIILIPFHLLKLRKLMNRKNGPDKTTINSLKNLVETDILQSIETNQQLGNITPSDAHQLISLTKKLYTYLYDAYTETEEVWNMIDQSLELESDALILKMEAMENTIKDMDVKMADKLAEIADKNAEIADKDAEIERLKAELAKLQTRSHDSSQDIYISGCCFLLYLIYGTSHNLSFVPMPSLSAF